MTARAVRPFDWALPPRPIRHREVATVLPPVATGRPPLLFVPGWRHGAWCYAEHWLPVAAARGFPAHAVSLRGHGGSDGASRLGRTLPRDYVHDLMQTIVTLPEQPVLIGHSGGAAVVSRVIEDYPARAAVFLAPAPLRHGARAAAHLARSDPRALLHALAGAPLPMSRATLFGAQLPAAEASRHLARLDGESPWVQYLTLLPHRPRPARCPVLVVGSPDDRLVPPQDVAETARHYDTTPVWFPGMGHDLMLDARWAEPLETILGWIERTVQD